MSIAERRERVREGVTMALYVSLSLLGVTLALPATTEVGSATGSATTIGLTSLSLVLAHQLAFRLSSRLVQRGRLTRANTELLVAQLFGGLAVTVVAVIPVLVLGGAAGVRACQLVLLLFVAAVGYAAARTVPVSRARAVTYVTIVVTVALAVVAVKRLVAH